MKAFILASMITLVSCTGGGGGSSEAPVVDTGAFSGVYYSYPAFINRTSAVGFYGSYSCDDVECTISGEILMYFGTTAVIYMNFNNETLAKSAGGYYGQIDIGGGTNYGLQLNNDGSFKSVDNGVKCLSATTVTDQNGYDNFFDSFTAPNQASGVLDFTFAGNKNLCGL